MPRETKMEVLGEEWKAIVAWHRQEREILRDSYGIPGAEDATFEAEYRKQMPEHARIYAKARDALKAATKRAQLAGARKGGASSVRTRVARRG